MSRWNHEIYYNWNNVKSAVEILFLWWFDELLPTWWLIMRDTCFLPVLELRKPQCYHWAQSRYIKTVLSPESLKENPFYLGIPWVLATSVQSYFFFHFLMMAYKTYKLWCLRLRCKITVSPLVEAILWSTNTFSLSYSSHKHVVGKSFTIMPAAHIAA